MENNLNLYCAILLAAGSSRRFGSNKLLFRLSNGLQLAVATIRPLMQMIDSVFAVVSPGENQLKQLLMDEGANIVICEEAEQGIGKSLATGIAAARTSSCPGGPSST